MRNSSNRYRGKVIAKKGAGIPTPSALPLETREFIEAAVEGGDGDLPGLGLGSHAGVAEGDFAGAVRRPEPDGHH